MQEVHLTCSREHLFPMLDALTAQFQAREDEVSITDYGQCQKSEHWYMVLTWIGEVDEAFIEQLNADGQVLDYSVYTVPCIGDDLPFGIELVAEREGSTRC